MRLQELLRSRRTIIALFIVGYGLIMLIFLFAGSGGDEEGLGTGQEFSDPEGPALITNSVELYGKLDDNRYFEELAENLGVFARTAIPEENEIKDIVFRVGSSTQRNDNTVTFSGSFVSSGVDINVRMELLRYGRVSLSLNGDDLQNIDDQLPANSQRNVYISTLPVSEDSYEIDYAPTSDTFSITLYDQNPAVETQAINTLRRGIGGELSPSEYSTVTPSWVTGGLEQ